MGRNDARGDAIDPSKIQVFHCRQRCVRRAFLCGRDAVTGRNYDHRRDWIRQRLELLASIFGIDCLTYSVMENHLHVVLRSRPDVVAQWSDENVARRWCWMCPGRTNKDGSVPVPKQSQIDEIVNNPAKLKAIRTQLSDISWWMKFLDEFIGRTANREDGVTGHFWEERFKAEELVDEASLLACAAYVDLNPIRAAMAQDLESSDYTGVKDRIDDLVDSRESTDGSNRKSERERNGKRARSGWLSPIEIDELADPLGHDSSRSGRRASDKGFLPFSLESYLELLDWTGRQVRADKRGAIPAHLEPILSRLGLNPTAWCDLVANFRRSFRRAAGRATNLRAEAERDGQRWLPATASLG